MRKKFQIWTCTMLLVLEMCPCLTGSTWTRNYDEDDDLLIRYLRAHERYPGSIQCTEWMRSCIPGNKQCCDELLCRNKFGHVCLYPLENCYCIDNSD